MRCRCGHGRQWHYRNRLSGWERGRGQTGPRPGAWLPCHFVTAFVNRKTCRCRNYHPPKEVSR